MIEDQNLICPKCKDVFLHQKGVKNYVRTLEDADGLIVSTTYKGDTTVAHASSEIMPGRRDTLDITFSCEICPAPKNIYTLRVQQHKGNTLVSWL